uniref:Tudor domain-containing protein n=1 Tax=Panagrellus redivivus TaxID=6233 RepID=A0A7E4ZWE1_PANRE
MSNFNRSIPTQPSRLSPCMHFAQLSVSLPHHSACFSLPTHHPGYVIIVFAEMSENPSSFAAEFHRLVAERCREAPPVTPRDRTFTMPLPTPGFNPDRPVGNPVTANPERRMGLHLDRPFFRHSIGIRHWKPNFSNVSQESARVFNVMQKLKAQNDTARFQFEQGRRRGGEGSVPPLPSGVTLTMEAQGQEFTNLLLTDLPWTNDPDFDNIHKIDADFPDVYFSFSDHANLIDTKPDTFNQIKITGNLHDVDQVRQRLLNIVPCLLCLPVLSYCTISENEIASRLQEMQNPGGPLAPFHRIQFFTNDHLEPQSCVEASVGRAFGSMGVSCTVYIIIKGAMFDYSMIKHAVAVLRDILYPIPTIQPAFISGIDFPQTLEPWLNDPQIAAIIAAKTDATILTPDFTKVRGINVVLTFYVYGEAEGVLAAVAELHRAVPIRLTFHCEHNDIKNGPFTTSPWRILDYVDADNCFLVELRPSEYEVTETQKRHRISITSAHENINLVYAAYGWILDTAFPKPVVEETRMKMFTMNTLNRLKQRNVVDGRGRERVREKILADSRTLVFLKELPNPQASTYKGYDYEARGNLYNPVHLEGQGSDSLGVRNVPSAPKMEVNGSAPPEMPSTPLQFWWKKNPKFDFLKPCRNPPTFKYNPGAPEYQPRDPPYTPPPASAGWVDRNRQQFQQFQPQLPRERLNSDDMRRQLNSTGSGYHPGGRVFYRTQLNSNPSNPPNRRYSHH